MSPHANSCSIRPSNDPCGAMGKKSNASDIRGKSQHAGSRYKMGPSLAHLRCREQIQDERERERERERGLLFTAEDVEAVHQPVVG